MINANSTYQSAQFSLTYTQRKQECFFDFQSHYYLATNSLPHTIPLLQQLCPTVLNTICHNNNNFSFVQEVQDTEIGHLFEHILIDQLRAYKLELGRKKIYFKGETEWNWYKYPRGNFHITISLKKREENILKIPLRKTIDIVEKILNSASWAGSHQLPAPTVVVS